MIDSEETRPSGAGDAPIADAAASTELTHVCYSCGGSITADANLCPHCGTDLTEEIAGAHHSTHRRDYSRRHRVDADDLDRFTN